MLLILIEMPASVADLQALCNIISRQIISSNLPEDREDLGKIDDIIQPYKDQIATAENPEELTQKLKNQLRDFLRIRSSRLLNSDKDCTINSKIILNGFWGKFAEKCAAIFKTDIIYWLIPALTDIYKIDIVSLNPYRNENICNLIPITGGSYVTETKSLLQLWETEKEFHVHTRGDDGWERRALTLTELASLSLKDPVLSPDSKLLLEKINTEIAPIWQKNGQTLRPCLYTTYKFLESYFDYLNTAPQERAKLLNGLKSSWSEIESFLLILPQEDVYHFYSEIISEPKSPSLRVWQVLVDLYLNIYSGKPINPASKSSLAKWLVRQDVSFVFNSPAIPDSLKNFYKEQFYGSHLNVGLLKSILRFSALGESAFKEIIDNDRYKMVPSTARVPPEMVTAVLDVVKNSWKKYQNTTADFTRVKNNREQVVIENNLIRLVQCLAGAGLISSNWYEALMPESGFDVLVPGYEYPTNCFPLTWFVRGDNGQYFNVLSVQKEFTSTGTAHRWVGGVCTPLTEAEKGRAAHTDPRFNFYIKKEEGLPISVETAKIFIDFANGAYFSEEATKTYSPEHARIANEAYQVLLRKIESLDQAEREKLYKQVIQWQNTEFTCKEWLDRIQMQDQYCIATVCKHFIQMVLDYTYEAAFNADIQKQDWFAKMQKQSKKRLFREYAEISSETRSKFTQFTMIALLTHVNDGSANNDISFLKFLNRLSGFGKSLFEILQCAFGQKPSEDAAEWVFARTVEQIKLKINSYESLEGVLKKVADENFSEASMQEYFVNQMVLLITPNTGLRFSCNEQEKTCFRNFVNAKLKAKPESSNWMEIIAHLIDSLTNQNFATFHTTKALEYLKKIQALNKVLMPQTLESPPLSPVMRTS